MKTLDATVLVLVAVLFPLALTAQPLPVGEFQVNSYTPNHQSYPSVAVAPDGDFVVVWASERSEGTDSDGSSVLGQRFGSNGFRAGSEFQVNTFTTANQELPSVRLGPVGEFVVVWQSFGSGESDSDGMSVQGQRFDSDGVRIGAQFQVNTYTSGAQDRASVAFQPNGDFVVTWQSDGSSASDSSNDSVQGQRYGSDGLAFGGEFQVNSYTTGLQGISRVAADGAGNFVVTWSSVGSPDSDTSGFGIRGRRFNSTGLPLGDEFQANTFTTDHQVFSAVGMDEDGGFVVVWQSQGSPDTDSSPFSVQGQRYDSDGLPIGGEFQVNSYTTDNQERPSLVVEPDGDFVVVWHSYGSSGTDSWEYSIQGQRYGSDGQPVAAEFQINTYTTAYQTNPFVAADANGGFLVVWDSDGSRGTDSWGFSIQGQHYATPLFYDGFESGDTVAW